MSFFAVVVAASATAGRSVLITVNSTENTALGSILIGPHGKTLYHDGSEKKNVVKCTGACAKEWPPLLIGAGAKPIAGPGVKATMLGTVKRPDGTFQVTYHGLPLYLFSGDAKAGDVKGQGDDGIWHALAPTGAAVTKAATTGSTSAKSSTSGSSTSSGSSAGSSGSSSGSGSSAGSGSSSGSGTSGSGTTTTPTDCDTNPGGYGCM
ncbi:MAG TPA: hypothetical protein VG265_09640 [Gaiellaceae bacterium]|nr:hypothetical protein [Gaiellaceae bacterium]